ncbi:hypothetical protein AB8919_19355, partial [Yersinia enterocolitica]
ERQYPKSLVLQVGGQQTHPDELTVVSDSGECAQLTTLQLQGRKAIPKVIGVAGRRPANSSR